MGEVAPGSVARSDTAWQQWAKGNVPRRYRKTAVAAAMDAFDHGATSDQAAAAAHAAAKEANWAYQARSALVIGVISLVVAVVLGGISILGMIFTLISGIPGRKSATRSREAYIGLALGVLSLIVFAGGLALRR